jgi:hypothetical protein
MVHGVSVSDRPEENTRFLDVNKILRHLRSALQLWFVDSKTGVDIDGADEIVLFAAAD